MGSLKLPKLLQPGFGNPKVKPTVPTEIDWSNPVTQGLHSLLSIESASKINELVHGGSTSVGGTPSLADTPRGQALFLEPGDSVQVEVPVQDLSEFTMMWTSTDQLDAANRGKITLSNSGSSTNRYLVYSSQALFMGTTVSNVLSGNQALSPAPVSDNGIHHNIITGKSGDLKWYIDGELWVSSSSTFTGITYNRINLGSWESLGVLSTGRQRFLDAGVWSRALSESEVASLTREPNQLLKPGNDLQYFVGTAGGASGAITGTATATIDESDVVTGGKTIIITLTGDTWVASGAAFNAQRQNIIDGLDSAQSELTGWNAEVRDKESVTAVSRTSDTVCTITLSASASYDITAQETITVTIPATALVTSAIDVTGSPTFTVDPVSGFQAAWAMSANTVIQ